MHEYEDARSNSAPRRKPIPSHFKKTFLALLIVHVFAFKTWTKKIRRTLLDSAIATCTAWEDTSSANTGALEYDAYRIYHVSLGHFCFRGGERLTGGEGLFFVSKTQCGRNWPNFGCNFPILRLHHKGRERSQSEPVRTSVRFTVPETVNGMLNTRDGLWASPLGPSESRAGTPCKNENVEGRRPCPPFCT